MRTVRCSGHREEGCVSQDALGGGCLPAGVSAGGCLPGGCLPDTPFSCEQNDWQTPVKILPSQNFVADGNFVTILLLYIGVKPSIEAMNIKI